jgi:hypothetical protein
VKLTFRGEVFEFNPEDMSYPEGEFFQKTTGMKVGEWLNGLSNGDVKSLAAAAWFASWQGGHKDLRLKDLLEDPTFRPLKDIVVEADADPTETTADAESEST